VLVPNDRLAEIVEHEVPETVGRVDIVPRSVEVLRTDGTDLRRSLGIPRHRALLLLPGGLRPIKAQHRALGLVEQLRSAGVDAEMILVGPEQDAKYARELRDRAEGLAGVRILPALSRERMGAAYVDADVVLNTSEHEAMSPVILEAGMLGRPVVAANNDGNAGLIKHKESGLLFDTEEELAKCVLALLRKRSAAGALGVRLREDLRRRFTPDQEIASLLSAYAAA
jgi:glycosyltransferase involved in cell wall biosynthesis